MWHIQEPMPNWTETLSKLPNTAMIKATQHYQLFREVKEANPNIFTVHRMVRDSWQHYTGQLNSGWFDWETAKNLSRNWFNAFVDGTFRNDIAQYCDAVSWHNEIWANSQNEVERQERIRATEAAIHVWNTEYRPTLPGSMKLIIGEAAVGNWMPRRIGELAVQTNNIVGYHPYDWWYKKQRAEEGWVAATALLHDTMERDWGLKPEWALTENGPIESAVTGWRSSECLGFDRDLYVEAVRIWIRDIAPMASYQEGRIRGFSLFTTGRASNTWKYFWTEQPELNMLADMIAHEWKPGTITIPPLPPEEPGDVPYIVVVDLGPQEMSLEEKQHVLEDIHERKGSFTQSANDAARLTAPGMPGSKVRSWASERWSDTGNPQDIVDWLLDEGVQQVELMHFPNGHEPTVYEIIDVVDELPKHATLEYAKRSLSDITTIVIHHTVSSCDRSTAAIASYHVAADANRNKSEWPGIGYHFVIGCDGKIEKTNRLDTISYHSGVYGHDEGQFNNIPSVAISLKDDFTHHPPTQEAKDAARWLVAELQRVLGPKIVKTHKSMPGAQTACPGVTSPEWFPYVAGYVD